MTITIHADRLPAASDVSISELSKDGRDSLAVRFAIRPALIAPDLAPPPAPLTPIFPLEIKATQLVLFEGAANEVRVRWHLQNNDYVRASHDFPVNGGQPLPVLRLRRLRDDGTSEDVEERRPWLAGNRGEGETGFRVGPDAARFEAELGLANAAGGWLLLARSNRLEHAAGIGLKFPAVRERADVQPILDPTLDLPPGELTPEFPAPVPGAGRNSGWPSEACARMPREENFSVAIRGVAWSESNPDGVEEAAGPGQPTVTHNRVFATRLARDLLNDKAATAASATLAQESSEPAIAGTSRIPTLIYGRSSPQCAELLIEAELHIHGWAAPNTEIDLFGRRYHVGPGGRFQFVVKVDEPTLLKQALMLHPPPELDAPRNNRSHT
ncbi:hypothetical protein CCR95_09855 [Thiocystis minor]|uniref:hypothetical protein n=1 Tax=Thiocystis minor TaxID=61597 RepID=UPI00191365B5|nr:hypothetical protein [Thiocystis minor]MBK5964379.1 hypothetical protein [Thiocystis minor]